MPLGDTYIEGTVWHRLHHDVHGASCRHGWRHTYNLRVLLSQFQQRLTENILIFRRLVAGIGNDSLTRFRIEFAWRVPDGSTLLGWFVTLSLGGMQVQQLRTLHVLKLFEHSRHFLHVMTVERSEVADIHTLEDVLLMTQCRLQCIVQAQDALLAVFVEIAFGVQPLRCLETEAVVGLVGIEVQKIFLHTAHCPVDAHIVVVQDDEHVVRCT